MGRLIDEDPIYVMGYNRGFKNAIKASIPKADYETRLKADMVAMLKELQLEIEKHTMTSGVTNQGTWNECIACCSRVIHQKIDALKGN